MLSVRHMVPWSAAVSALVCGGCLAGAWFWWRGARTELVLRDDEGRVAAQLVTRGKMTELVFCSTTGVEVATSGVDRFSAARHLVFRDTQGRCLVDGSIRWIAARVQLGAEYGDIVGAPPDACGLVVRPGPGPDGQVAARVIRRTELQDVPQ